MAEKIVQEYVKEIRNSLSTDNFIIGTEKTIKELKSGKLNKVFLSNSVPTKTVEDVNYYAKLTETEVEVLPINNIDLGILCKKPFLVSIVSIRK